MEQVITPYTLGQLVLVGNPLFSPDGTMLAYTVGRIDIQKNRSLGDLCILRDGIHHMPSLTSIPAAAQFHQPFPFLTLKFVWRAAVIMHFS